MASRSAPLPAGLLLDRLSRFFPSVKTFLHVEHVLEFHFLDFFTRPRAASARGAMNHVGFGFIQLGNAIREILVLKIDIRRALNMTGLKFFGRSDIEHDD